MKVKYQFILATSLMMLSIYIWSYIMHLSWYNMRDWYGFPNLIFSVFSTIAVYVLPFTIKDR